MKFSKLYLILNILIISILFSSGEDAPDDEIRTISSKTKIKITNEDSPEPEPLTADIIFYDNENNEVVEAKNGDTLQLNIKVKATKTYKDGQVIECEIYETLNPSIKKTIYSECAESEKITGEWSWNEAEQAFSTEFKVSTLPDSSSDDFTIECTAQVCGSKCAKPACPSGDKRKRRRALWSLRNKIRRILPNSSPKPAS